MRRNRALPNDQSLADFSSLTTAVSSINTLAIRSQKYMVPRWRNVLLLMACFAWNSIVGLPTGRAFETLTYSQISAKLQHLAKTYPDLVQVRSFIHNQRCFPSVHLKSWFKQDKSTQPHRDIYSRSRIASKPSA